MHYISFLIFLTGLFITSSVYPQKINPRNQYNTDFVSPLDIPLFLSSNYGEYRAGHFHAGVDFKTQQVEGKNVFAVDAGTVYRVVVFSGGYGNAVYLKHPSGYITLYGHLSKFEPALEKYVREQQYRKKSFTVDLYPDAGKFSYAKGAFIGLSGNSGNSFGAHLHFEVRDNSGSVPLNPLHFGFDVKDAVKPEIHWLKVYALDTGSYVNGLRKNLQLKVKKGKSGYTVSPDTIRVSGNIGLGIESYDFLDNTLNQCGPAAVEMAIDNDPFFLIRFDSVSFDAGGYINSYYDYGEMLLSGKKFQKLFIDPNNNLSIYKLAINRGFIDFNDDNVHAVRVRVRDTYNNESELKFYLRSESEPVYYPEPKDSFVVSRFYYDSLNVYENENIRIAVPKNALFDHLDFRYHEHLNDSVPFSMIHRVHNRFTPLIASYILSIRPVNLPAHLHEKAYLAIRNAKGAWVSQGGEYKNGFITGRVRAFGDFIITVDTLVPEIRPVTFSPGGRYQASQVLSFKISDTLSGIQRYAGYIDNNWALFEYDAKNDLLSYQIDGTRLQSGKQHDLEIMVTDHRGNVAKYKNKFFY